MAISSFKAQEYSYMPSSRGKNAYTVAFLDIIKNFLYFNPISYGVELHRYHHTDTDTRLMIHNDTDTDTHSAQTSIPIPTVTDS